MATTSGDHDEHDDGPADDRPIPTKWAIDRIDDREKRFAFGASGLAVALSFYVRFGHFKAGKGQLHPETVFVIGLVGAALLLGATFLGRRAPLGFVALFLGASFAQVALALALPFFALAVWLLYSSYKVQKELTARVRAAKGTGPTPTARSQSRSAGAAPQPRTRSQAAGKAAPARKSAKGPARPTPNKRYTPKQPPAPAPPPPKLSRRERKAAAQD
jgi:hypothetical protein